MSCENYPNAQDAKTFKENMDTEDEIVTSSSALTSIASDGFQKTTLEGLRQDASQVIDNYIATTNPIDAPPVTGGPYVVVNGAWVLFTGV